jgi:hypothetical protein
VDASRPTPPTTQLGESGTHIRAGRLVLLLIAGAVALLCTGGAGVAFVAYRDATEPDRSSPDAAVDNYLRAYLVDRDDVLAGQYSCADGDLATMTDFREDLTRREQRFNTRFTTTWGSLSVVEINERMAEVAVELRISAFVDGHQQSDLQSWTLVVKDEDGWRVCETRRP